MHRKYPRSLRQFLCIHKANFYGDSWVEFFKEALNRSGVFPLGFCLGVRRWWWWRSTWKTPCSGRRGPGLFHLRLNPGPLLLEDLECVKVLGCLIMCKPFKKRIPGRQRWKQMQWNFLYPVWGFNQRSSLEQNQNFQADQRYRGVEENLFGGSWMTMPYEN